MLACKTAQALRTTSDIERSSVLRKRCLSMQAEAPVELSVADIASDCGSCLSNGAIRGTYTSTYR